LTLSHDVAPAATPTGNTYDKYGVEHPIERRLVDGFLRALDSVLPATPPQRVLEVGAGEGEISDRVRKRYPDATVIGIDLLDPELGEQWRRRGAIGAFADVARLPFPDDSFDLVLAIEVLEHVDLPSRALSEIRRVGRSSFVLSVPREPVWRIANVLRGRYIRQLGNTPGHVNHWSTRRFRTLVDTYLDLRATRTPFPWTLVAAHRRPPPRS
jgi:ubiquinone/menaquinone biosynthesis C-methylase UbiE